MTLTINQFASDWRYGMFDMLAKVINGELPHMNADEIHRKMLDLVLGIHSNLKLSDVERNKLNTVWKRLKAWPDAPLAIEKLRIRYTVVPLTVLSWSIGVNCSKHNRISWDGLLSCEFLRQYKPDSGAYIHASELFLDTDPSEIMMCAAHTRDLKSTMNAGFKSAFIYRAGEKSLETMTEEPTVPLNTFDISATDFTDLTNQLLP
jgi:2-haloacid dehalogenase